MSRSQEGIRKVPGYGHIWVPSAFPDREPETCPIRERLERIFRSEFFVDIHADSWCVVEEHVPLLHLRTTWKNLLNDLSPAEINVLLNAEIRYREVYMA